MNNKIAEIQNAYSEVISRHRRLIGSVLVTIGYILSPASWWNDAVVNIPIAYVFGWLASLVSAHLFLPVMLLAYWGTNVLGILMLHVGATYILRKELPKKHWKLRRTFIITALYTILMLALANFGILHRPF